MPSTVPLVGRDHELARCAEGLQRAAGTTRDRPHGVTPTHTDQPAATS